MGNTLFRTKFWKMLPSSTVAIILGCTGTGKSKLAIELAKTFNGEIISADSMQVYKGLDIVTNKVTAREQKEAVHHLINCVDPLSRYTVVDFRNKALPLIYRLLKENKMPIIVGGTNYYIESLLWEVLVNPQEEGNKLLWDEERKNENKLSADSLNFTDISLLLQQKITQDSVQDVPNDILHKALQQVDPVMANTLHPEDRRKVIRSLQVYQQHGCTHSEILANQRSQDGGSTLGGPLRFKNSVMLWLQCDKEVLEQRLNDRVNDMIKRGLVDELLDFHKCYNEKRLACEKLSYTEGIFQSIGFKEFHEYLILPEEKRNDTSGKKALERAIEDMKLVTRQYARKQIKWIVNRFLRKPDRQVPPVYGLDATNLDLWKENVLDAAAEIVQALKENRIPSQKPLPLQESLQDVPETHYCEICDRIFVGRRTWEIHINSKKHSRRKASLKKADKKTKEQIIMH